MSAIKRILPQAEVFGKACPLFVPLVESGRVNPGDIVIETVAKEYLFPLKDTGIDTLILGCTHYPLLSDIISEIMGPGVALVDSGAQTAEYTAKTLENMGLLSARKEEGRRGFYVTDRVEGFSELASLFLHSDIKGDVSQVALDNF